MRTVKLVKDDQGRLVIPPPPPPKNGERPTKYRNEKCKRAPGVRKYGHGGRP